MATKTKQLPVKPRLGHIHGSFSLPIYVTPTWADGHSVDDGMCVLLDNFQVDSQLYESVVKQYTEIRPSLISMGTYTREELLGDRFLAGLSDLGKRLADLVLKHMANEDRGELHATVIDGKPAFGIIA